jgi:uncharacterized protein YggE
MPNLANAAIRRDSENDVGKDPAMRTKPGALLIFAAVALLVGAEAHAQGDEEKKRLVSVTGEATVEGAPDMALITLGVVSEAKAAVEALSANSQSMKRILDALKQGGIEPRDLQTSGFSVQPVYSQPPQNQNSSEPFRPEILGYRIHNNITLRIRDLTRTGAVLDQVVTLGANSISGPTFTIDDPTTLQDRARGEAIADALRKGQLYATAADIDLGPIYRIEEIYAAPPQPYAAPMMMRAEAAQSDVPIEGGALTFRMQVAVSWQIED